MTETDGGDCIAYSRSEAELIENQSGGKAFHSCFVDALMPKSSSIPVYVNQRSCRLQFFLEEKRSYC